MIAALVAVLATGSGLPAAVTQDPPIRLWINEDRHFERGDRAKVQVETDQDGYVVVLHADPDGRVRVLFPIDPGDDNFLRGGHRYEVRGRGNRESFTVDVSTGQGTVYAAVSPDPFRFDDFVQGDHWDYRALNATELSRDPEPDLTDLVRRMAGGRFDYDLLSYDVSYGASYSSTAYYAAAPLVARRSYYDPFCDFSWDCDPYYFTGRSSLSVNLVFGRPYRSYYYDPFNYNPFYYDPFYYGGYGYNYRPAYRSPGYYPGYYTPRSVYQGQIYSPYQFKAVNRTWSGGGGISRFGRDNIGQATHTVYGPPRNQPAIGTPSRPGLDGKPRVTPVADPVRNDAADARRRRVENSQRPDNQRNDARRAEPRQTDARPQEVKPDRQDRGAPDRGTQDRGSENRGSENRGSEGRRADPVRSGQRDRQAERARRFDAMPEARRVQPEQGQRGFQPRDYQPQPESRQYQPPQREQQREQPREQPRAYQPPQREYQPPQREAQPQREQPRAEPRAAPPPRQEGGFSRPSEANQGRFRK
jgi:hypothetical protein